MGSGPFQLTQYKKDSYAIMTANKSYWAGAPKIDQVDFVYYQNADTMVQEMKAGSLQGAWGVLEAQYRQLKNDPTYKPLAFIDPELDELGFNCYTGPSLGNPVLRDWHFRQALQWAVDHNKLVQIAYGGLAQPATSVLVSHLWSNPDWHWEPPAGQAYTFDLAKAGQMLTAAGYPLKNGVRLNKQGKPIVLRLWTRVDADSSQSAGKLIAGWFDKLGLKINLSVMDDGVIAGRPVQHEGQHLRAQLRHVPLGLGRRPRPQLHHEHLHDRPDQQLERLRLVERAVRQALPRAADHDRPGQAGGHRAPDGADHLPAVALHPDGLPRVGRGLQLHGWQGWSTTPGKGGGVFFTSPVMASYLTVHPATAAAAAAAQSSSKGLLIAVIVLIVVVMAIVALVVALRGRKRQVEETI